METINSEASSIKTRVYYKFRREHLKKLGYKLVEVSIGIYKNQGFPHGFKLRV